MLKRCFRCRQRKPLAAFYRHPMMADGRLGKCKDCTKSDALKHRNENLEKIRQYDRERAKLPHRRASARQHTERWRKADPRRQIAHNAAIRHHRKAPRCCQMCGLEKKLERHHPDYDLPLLVVWVCKPCHAIADATRRTRESKTSASVRASPRSNAARASASPLWRAFWSASRSAGVTISAPKGQTGRRSTGDRGWGGLVFLGERWRDDAQHVARVGRRR